MPIRIGINGFGRIGRLVYRIAAQRGLKTVDLRTALEKRGELFADHIHPNAEGATIIAQEVAKSLGR